MHDHRPTRRLHHRRPGRRQVAVGFHINGFSTQYFDDSSTFAGANDVSVTTRATTGGIDASLLPLGSSPRVHRMGPPAGVARARTAGRAASGVSGSKQAALGAGELVLLSSQIAVSRSGIATVKLQCKGAGACQARLQLIATRTIHSHGRLEHEHVVLGTLELGLAGGRRNAARLHLTRAGRALLAAGHGSLAAKLSIFSPSLAAAARTSLHTVHLHGSAGAGGAHGHQ